MNRFSFSSLRARLLLLVLLVIIPSFGLIVYMAWEERLQGSAQAGENALKIARQVAAEQRRLINDTRQLLSQLAQQPQVEKLDPTTCSAFVADQLKEHPRYSNFGAIGLNGDLICSALPFQAPTNLADREYFKATVASRDFSLGEFQIGRVTGKATLNFGYPLLDGKGTLRAILFAALDLAWVNSFMTDPSLPKGSVLNLIDSKGIILARHPEPAKWIGKSMKDIPLVKTILSAKDEGIAEVSGLDGIRRLYGFIPIRVSGEARAYLGVGIPTERAYADANRTLRLNLVLLGLVSLLVFAAAWFGGDFLILRRITDLVDAAKRLGSGDLSARTKLSYGQSELSQLARVFDDMAGSVERLTRQNRLILESAGDGIYGVDLEGKTTFINPAATKMLAYEVEELIGKPLHVIIHHTKPDGSLYPREECPIYAAFREGAVRHITDDVFWRKDGSSVPVEYVSTPIREGGEILGAVVAFKDITERKWAEKERARLFEETRRNLDRIRALREIDVAISSTLDLHAVLDVLLEKIDLFLPYASAATVRLMNKETGEVEATACRNLDAQEWKGYVIKSLGGRTKEVVQTKAPLTVRNLATGPTAGNVEFYLKQGLISYLGVPLLAKGEVLGVLGVYTKEEHEFDKEEVEFLATLAGQAAIAIHNAQLYEQTKKQAEELERAIKVKDEFLSVMSHELRTPLNVVVGYAGMMKDGMLGAINPQQEEALGKMISRANDQLMIVNNILYATVLELEKINVDIHEFVLGDFLNQLKSAYDIPAKKLAILWECAEPLVPIRTDSAKLKHILQNLIDNALKFTKSGEVKISAQIVEEGNRQQAIEKSTDASRPPPRAYVEFKVADTGVGIPKEHLPFIFDKFRQADSSETRSFGGVGMGLYIVKKFTGLLGGTVQVESEVERGSTFTVKIPIEF